MKDHLHELLHTLWSKAVGTPGYNKLEWIALEVELNGLSNQVEDLIKAVRED